MIPYEEHLDKQCRFFHVYVEFKRNREEKRKTVAKKQREEHGAKREGQRVKLKCRTCDETFTERRRRDSHERRAHPNLNGLNESLSQTTT